MASPERSCQHRPSSSPLGDSRSMYFLANFTTRVSNRPGFDVVLMLNVLEHLEQPSPYLAEIHRVLRPGGLLWLELPNASSFTATRSGKRWLHHDPDHQML